MSYHDPAAAELLNRTLAAAERVERFLAQHNSPEAIAQRARDLAFLRGEVSERFLSSQAQEAAQ